MIGVRIARYPGTTRQAVIVAVIDFTILERDDIDPAELSRGWPRLCFGVDVYAARHLKVDADEHDVEIRRLDEELAALRRAVLAGVGCFWRPACPAICCAPKGSG